ncbi:MULTISPECIES: 1-acyl-sn-glycerol-3-phosphate acyltransferase [Aeromicrobium]|uniref:1-acyl-sn-glycerol-3-phosphate acyltransferase n=1 Tax=Aeromicrobium phoceense TaxID=2754045 RepID=A0A838XE02_9ACTN|nr:MULTISPECIES: 1-acyl-sn-glycerol-3-phosphate acyltransferase [Aeromicrobium]MBA4607151.1 1-acyl-sn-glycerol-3-phosphate acyltransferase [Aeromicrobium phoceense]
MRILRLVADVFWTVSRWSFRSEPAPKGPTILLAGPHTSNWDFVLMLAIAWKCGFRPHFLGKKELFRGPAGPFMRALGGIEVDRKNPAGLIDELIEHARSGDNFQLVITPEGTRGNVKRWKSGFYRLAREADLPVTLGYCDRTTMTAGLGPTFRLTGDVRADMDVIRAFFADKAGVRPERRVEPRLAEEDRPAE